MAKPKVQASNSAREPVPVGKITHTFIDVMLLFVHEPEAQLTAVDILEKTGHHSGTIYPLLARLTQSHWLRTEWEKIDPNVEDRAPRRLYAGTDGGIRKAKEIIASRGTKVLKQKAKKVLGTSTVPA